MICGCIGLVDPIRRLLHATRRWWNRSWIKQIKPIVRIPRTQAQSCKAHENDEISTLAEAWCKDCRLWFVQMSEEGWRAGRRRGDLGNVWNLEVRKVYLERTEDSEHMINVFQCLASWRFIRSMSSTKWYDSFSLESLDTPGMTACGTLDYLAPEALLQQYIPASNAKSVDRCWFGWLDDGSFWKNCCRFLSLVQRPHLAVEFMLYSKTCGKTSRISALVSTCKVSFRCWKLANVKIWRKLFHCFTCLFTWKNRKQLGKAVKYLVHMPGVDGPIWRVRLVVSDVATFHQIRLIKSKRRRGRRGQADWLLELWGAPLRHVRRWDLRWIHKWFTHLWTANRLCGRLPFEIEGTSRSQLHVDANLKLSSFRDFSLGKTQHWKLKFFSSRSHLWINRIWISDDVEWEKAGGVADIKRITRERLSPQGVGTSVLHQV